MPFFHFPQNNSGGSFTGPAHHVIVEASSGAEANVRAQDEFDIYFDGCRSGMDCPCCGDRWHPIWGGDVGDDLPNVYGMDPAEYARKDTFKYRTGCSVLVAYADGTQERF